jgi:glycosyltransferase involved in cell wall biosynthesis
MASVIIPAHNEARSIGRLLDALGEADDLEIIVACNGCTDDTAVIARRYQGIIVVELDRPSKTAAMDAADAVAESFPRIYLDADVEISRASVCALIQATRNGKFSAAGPVRRIDCRNSSWRVRWWYDVWSELPSVKQGLFGRGVVCLSQQGHERLSKLPRIAADDLLMSAAFDSAETCVVPRAEVVIHAPRTWPDLVKRRMRVVTTTRDAYVSGQGLRRDSRTTISELLALSVRPTLAPKVVFYALASLLMRARAGRIEQSGMAGVWLRDESSRGG